MRFRLCAAVAALVVFSGLVAQASFPDSANYRGSIVDETGQPLNGSHDLEFRYFDQPGRKLLLVEQQPEIAIVDGRFQVMLGSGQFQAGAANNALQRVFASHAEVVLEVALDGQTQTPRIRIFPAGHSPTSRAMLAGAASSDRPHRQGNYSAGSATSVQAVKLSPTGKDVASRVQRSPLQQDNPFEIEVISLGESPAVRDLPSIDLARRPEVVSPAPNQAHHQPVFDDQGYRFGTRTKKIVDPLVGNSRGGHGKATTPAPLLDFAGIGNVDGIEAPDPEGTVGPDHYLQVVNTSFAVFDKNGTMLSGPCNTNTLWADAGGPCQENNGGDGIFLYDEQADRFVLTQLAFSGMAVCFAVSTTADPTGTYHRYQVDTQGPPDYFKLGVWPDESNNAYFMGTNSGYQFGYDVYAIDRANMLIGAPARPAQFFEGYANLLMPADLDGPNLPPPGSPGLFFTFLDGGETYFGSPPTDSLDVYGFDVDWITPANSTFTLLASIVPPELADFNWTVCGCFDRQCLAQPGTDARLDSNSAWPMQRLQYRNFGDYEILVGTWTVGLSATLHLAAPRWFELRRAGGDWSIHQQGTHSPDSSHRWMSSIAMDGDGNMAIGYSVVSAENEIYPSIRYATRAASDPPGTFRPEATLIDGTGVQTSPFNRWGDYASMELDPADDCTFWFTTEYIASTGFAPWETRIAAFKVPGCGALALESPTQEICTGSGSIAIYDVTLEAMFAGTTNLSILGCPSAASCSFLPDQVVYPVTTSTLEVSGLGGVSPGLYTLEVVAADSIKPGITASSQVELIVSSGTPGDPFLTSPSDGAIGVSTRPWFVWAASSGTSFDFQLATDGDFLNLLVDETGIARTTFSPVLDLATHVRHFWRVRAANACGQGGWSAVFDLTTHAPGDCPAGSVAQVLLDEDFESGEGSWTHRGSQDSWALSGARTHSGSNAFHADDPSFASNQYLITPPIDLRAGVVAATLKFWNHQTIQQKNFYQCHDGAFVEINFDGSANWHQLMPFYETDPYDGTIAGSGGNTARGHDAWCGGPQDWLQTAMPLDAYAGNTVWIRFRMTSGDSGGREGWYIDDVLVHSCVSPSRSGDRRIQAVEP